MTITTTEKRQLVANGYIDVNAMTTEEQRSALATIVNAPFTPAPAPAPTAPETWHGNSRPDPDELVNVFMTGGAEAFKRAIVDEVNGLETDLADTLRALEITQDDLAIEQAKPTGKERVIIKSADSSGTVIINTALAEHSAAELFALDDDDDLTVYATVDAKPADSYDFNTVARNGVLAHVAICQATQQNIWLAGPKGTGKTTFAQAYAKATGRPFHRISHMKQMECQDLIGSRIFDDTGAMVWADGQLTLAMRDVNAVILLDEPSLNPSACEMYQTILDEGYLTIPATGERVSLSPDHLVIAADNTTGDGDMSGGYHGTAPLNEAFVDRFAYVVKMEYMKPDVEAALLEKFCGAENARQIASYAADIRTACADGQVMEPVSFRRLEALAISIGCGMGAEMALTTAVFNHVRNETDEEFYRLKAAAILTLGAKL